MYGFSEAANGGTITLKNEIAIAKRAEKILNEVGAMGICLIGMLGKNQHYGSALRESIPDALYNRALRYTPFTMEDSHNLATIPLDIIDDFKPERLWPLAVQGSFYKMHGCNDTGYMEGSRFRIVSSGRNFPDNMRHTRFDFSMNAQTSLCPFLMQGAVMIKDHLGYDTDIKPEWLPDVIGAAFHHRIDLRTTPLEKWFPLCLHEALDFIYQQPAPQSSNPELAFH